MTAAVLTFVAALATFIVALIEVLEHLGWAEFLSVYNLAGVFVMLLVVAVVCIQEDDAGYHWAERCECRECGRE